MNSETFWMIICGAGVMQSLFLCFFFFLSDKIKRKERIIVGLLFLAISLRLIKSIGWFYFDVANNTFLNIGFISNGFIAPLMVLYFDKILLNKGSILKIAVMFLPPLVLIFISPFINLSNFWYVGGYRWLLYGTMIYLIWGGYLLFKIYLQKKNQFFWPLHLFIGVSLFCLLYFTNYITALNRYITGPIVYSLSIYYISFIVLRKQHLIGKNERVKYQNIRITEDQKDDYESRINEVMKNQRMYLNGDFTLSVLSEKTNIPKHLLSNYFNEFLNQSFTDYTNNFRIEEAKKRLTSPQYSNLKIAAIAYDCGFNSISAFNAAFKKRLAVSPSEFRSKKLD